MNNEQIEKAFGEWYACYPEGCELSHGDMLDGNGWDAKVGFHAGVEFIVAQLQSAQHLLGKSEEPFYEACKIIKELTDG